MQDTVDPAAAPPRTWRRSSRTRAARSWTWRRCRRGREGQCRRPGNPPPV